MGGDGVCERGGEKGQVGRSGEGGAEGEAVKNNMGKKKMCFKLFGLRE